MRLRNARLWDGRLADIELRGRQVAGVEPAGGARAGAGDVDLGGRLVIPGLWDHHVHLDQWVRSRSRLDLSHAHSAQAVLDAVARHVRTGPDAPAAASLGPGRDCGGGAPAWTAPGPSGEPGSTDGAGGPRAADGQRGLGGAGDPRDGVGGCASPRDARSDAGGEVVVGYGFWGSGWLEQVDAAMLDRAAGGRAVVLVGADLHSAWVSSAALRRLGLGGTGLVREQDWFALSGQLEAAPVTIAQLREAALAAAARGVVGVVDYEFADVRAAWERRYGEGFDLLRVECGVWPEHLDTAIASGWRTGAPLGTGGAPGAQRPETGRAPRGAARQGRSVSELDTGWPASWLGRLGRLKIIADGSLGSSTAYCYDAYPDGDHGRLLVEPAELRDLLARATVAGMEVAVHAIGDAAACAVADAFAATGARGSMEHAQLLRPDTVARLAELGLHAGVHPAHLLDDRGAMERSWPGRGADAFPLASLVAAGVQVELGSDAPVAALDPWVAVSAAVHRRRDGEPAWHPEQALDVATALAGCVDTRAQRPVPDAVPPPGAPRQVGGGAAGSGDSQGSARSAVLGWRTERATAGATAGAGRARRSAQAAAAGWYAAEAAQALTVWRGMRADLAVLDLVPGPAGGAALRSLGPGDLATMPVALTLLAGRATRRSEEL